MSRRQRGDFVWQAHKGACDACAAQNGKRWRLYAHVPDTHPNCECRIAYTGSRATLPRQRGYRPRTVIEMGNHPTPQRLDLGVGDVAAPYEPLAGKEKNRMKPRVKKAAKPPRKMRRVRVSADIGHGGRLSVRHMVDGGIRLEGAAITLADGADEAKPVWIQIAKPGKFLGHHAGPFELNDAVFAEIIANFNATTNRSVPIDMDHATEGEPHPVHGAPAHGWIQELKVDGGNLWGLVEWLPKTRDAIRAKQFKFLSPAVVLKSRDRVTGKPIGARLSSAAITNKPFLDGMQPLAATHAGDASAVGDGFASDLAFAPAEYMPAIKAALRLDELADPLECSDRIGRLRDRFDGDESTDDGVRLADYLVPLRDAVRARPSATWDDVFDDAEDMIDAAMGGALTNDADDGDVDGEGDQTMAEKEVAVALSEAKAQNAEISLKLSETTGKLTEATTKLSEATAKIEKLEKDAAGYVAEKNAARIEEAFETYKDKKSLTEADRENMAIVLNASPEKFEKAYPRVKPAERHLQRNLTTGREAAAGTTDDRPNLGGESFAATTKRLMKDDPKLSYADASERALQLRQHVRSAG